MTFYINGEPQNGINDNPRIAMNIVEPKTKQPDSTRAILRAMQANDLRAMNNCTPAEYRDFLKATDMMIDAANTNLMGRF